MPPRPRDPADHLVLTDPRALRALAHPARTAVVDELYQGKVRTSSELAELTGLTPSAMSYHLRALEKWGIVRRADASGDGRERPWQASAKGFSWSGQDAGDAASDAIAGLYLDRMRRDLAAYGPHADDEAAAWRDQSTINRGFPWMTAEEMRRLTDGVSALVDDLKRERDEQNHPEGARRVAFLFAAVPLVDQTTASEGRADRADRDDGATDDGPAGTEHAVRPAGPSARG